MAGFLGRFRRRQEPEVVPKASPPPPPQRVAPPPEPDPEPTVAGTVAGPVEPMADETVDVPTVAEVGTAAPDAPPVEPEEPEAPIPGPPSDHDPKTQEPPMSASAPEETVKRAPKDQEEEPDEDDQGDEDPQRPPADDDDEEEEDDEEPEERAPPRPRERTRPPRPEPEAPAQPRVSTLPRFAHLKDEDLVEMDSDEKVVAEEKFREGYDLKQVRKYLNEQREEEGRPSIPVNAFTSDRLHAIEKKVRAQGPSGSLSGSRGPITPQVISPTPQTQVGPHFVGDPLEAKKYALNYLGVTEDDIFMARAAKLGLLDKETGGDPELQFMEKAMTEVTGMIRDGMGLPNRKFEAAAREVNKGTPGAQPPVRRQITARPPPPALPPAPQAPSAQRPPTTEAPQPPAENLPSIGPEGREFLGYLGYVDQLADIIYPFIEERALGMPKENVLELVQKNAIGKAHGSWLMAGDRVPTHSPDDRGLCFRCEVKLNEKNERDPCLKAHSQKDGLRRLSQETPKTLMDRMGSMAGTIEANTPVSDLGNLSFRQYFMDVAFDGKNGNRRNLGGRTVFSTIMQTDEGLAWLTAFLFELAKIVEADPKPASAAPQGAPQATPPQGGAPPAQDVQPPQDQSGMQWTPGGPVPYPRRKGGA